MDVLTALHGIMHMDMYDTIVHISSMSLMLLTLLSLIMFHGEEIDDVRFVRTQKNQFHVEILREPSEVLRTLTSIKNVYHSNVRCFPKGSPMYRNSFVEYMNACKMYKRWSMAM